MLRSFYACKPFISIVVAVSVLTGSLSVMSQDIVAADDITGGASVFVFRESRKKPQEKSGGRGARAGGGGGHSASASKLQTQLAANRKRHAAQSKANAALLAKNRTRQRNAKIAQSNALTAKADTFLENNAVDQAITNYRDALKQNPKNTDASQGLSDALTAKAVQVAGDANSAAAIPLLEEAVKLDPRNDVAYAKLGHVYDGPSRATKKRCR